MTITTCRKLSQSVINTPPEKHSQPKYDQRKHAHRTILGTGFEGTFSFNDFPQPFILISLYTSC